MNSIVVAISMLASSQTIPYYLDRDHRAHMLHIIHAVYCYALLTTPHEDNLSDGDLMAPYAIVGFIPAITFSFVSEGK